MIVPVKQGFAAPLTSLTERVFMPFDEGYAADLGLSVSVQATGHGGGAPAADGLLINTCGMRSIAINPDARTARVGAGVRWGAVIEVDAEHQPELFWALRGGKCSVGIVTEIEFDLMPVANFFGGGIFYPASAASAILHAFGQWAPTLPEAASTSIVLLRLPNSDDVPAPLRGKFAVHLRYVYVGNDEQGAAGCSYVSCLPMPSTQCWQ